MRGLLHLHTQHPYLHSQGAGDVQGDGGMASFLALCERVLGEEAHAAVAFLRDPYRVKRLYESDLRMIDLGRERAAALHLVHAAQALHLPPEAIEDILQPCRILERNMFVQQRIHASLVLPHANIGSSNHPLHALTEKELLAQWGRYLDATPYRDV